MAVGQSANRAGPKPDLANDFTLLCAFTAALALALTLTLTPAGLQLFGQASGQKARCPRHECSEWPTINIEMKK